MVRMVLAQLLAQATPQQRRLLKELAAVLEAVDLAQVITEAAVVGAQHLRELLELLQQAGMVVQELQVP